MKLLKVIFSYIKKYPILIVTILIGWAVNLSFFLPVGQNLGHDVYWHMALVETAFNTFPFQMPVLSGETLRGYNYLIDFFMFLLTKLGISALNVYTLVIPLIYITIFSLLIIIVGLRINKSIRFMFPFVFFSFLATPFSYLLSFYKRGSLFYGFYYPTAMQSSTALTNISYAFTVLLLLWAIFILQKKTQSIKDRLLLSFIITLSFGLKFYGGIIIFCLIFIHEFFVLISNKKIAPFVILSISSLIGIILMVIFLYDPFSSMKTGGIFAFSPLAFPHNLIEDPDALYIPQFVMARYAIQASGKFSPRLLLIDSITVIIYLIYNFGTRIIGLVYLASAAVRRKASLLDISLFGTIIISITLSLTLIQKGGDWWNTVQFFGYGLFLFNYFSAKGIVELYSMNKKIVVFLVVVIVILTMPLNIELIMQAYARLGNSFTISDMERKALVFLKKQQNHDAVFALPLFEKTSYIPAFSGKPVYFADEGVISNLGYQYEARKKQISNLETLRLDTLPVRYYYMKRKDKDYEIILEKIRKQLTYKEIFNNEEIIIIENFHQL